MDPSDSKVITLSSFLAGALLIRRSITSFEISNYMNDFTKKYNCDVDEPINDFNKLADIVYFDGSIMYLREDNAMIDNYLYDLTTDEVREYFGIEEKENIKVYEDKKVKRKTFADMIKRTKVYVKP